MGMIKKKAKLTPTTAIKTPFDDDDEVVEELQAKEIKEDELDDGFTPIQRAKAVQEALKLPPVPSRKPTFAQLMDWMGLLTKDQLDQLVIYVYRMHPAINRRFVDATAKSYIDKIMGKFTESDIIQRHGGGAYKIHVTAPGQTEKSNLCQVELEVDMGRWQPILAIEELDVNAAKNKSYVEYLKNTGKIAVTQEGRAMQVTPKQTDGAAAEILAKTVERLATQKESSPQVDPTQIAMKSFDAASSIYEKMAAQNDPSALMAMMMKVVEMMKPATVTGTVDGGMSSIFPMILQFMQMMMSQQAEASKANMEMFKLLMEQKAAQLTPPEKEEEDPIDKFTKYLELAKTLRGGGGGQKDTWEKVAEYVAPVLAPALNTLAQFAVVKGMPAGVHPPALANPQSGGNVIPMPTPNGNSEEHQIQEMAASMKNYAGIILNALANKQSGYEFAQWVVDGFGMMAYSTIANMGPDRIVTVMKTLPDFWNHPIVNGNDVKGEAKIKAWVTEFCGWEEWAAKQDEEEGEE